MAIDQEKLNKEFIYEGRGVAAELIAGLDQLAPIEAKMKSRPARIRWAALGVFIILIALFVATKVSIFLLLTVVIPLALLIYSLFAAAHPVVHDRVELLRLSLNTLNRDAGKKSLFDVSLRLRAKKEKLSEGPNPRKAGGKQILFKDPWLTLSARLADGTTVSESYIDLIRQRTKRNPRGKLKTKERRIVMIRVQLNYDPAVYGDASSAATKLVNPLRLPGGVQLKSVNTTARNVTVKAIVKGNLSTQSVHAAGEAMLLGAYRVLNLARRRIAATRGAK